MRKLRLIILGLLVIPSWIHAIILRKKDKFKINASIKRWCLMVISDLGYKLDVKGLENLTIDKSIYFVSNHQGTFDPAIIIAACNVPLSFISKVENLKLPLIGSWSLTLDNIHFDRSAREGNIHMLRESARRLKAGDNMLIFPEGTRSKCDNVSEFKVGSIQPAYLSKATIIPVTLNNSYAFDQSKPKSKLMGVTFGKPIPYEEYKKFSQEEVSVYLRDIVKKEIIEC